MVHTPPPTPSQPNRQRFLALAALGFLVVPVARAQTVETSGPTVSTTQVVSIGTGILLGVVPSIFDINTSPPSCAPCDPSMVPAFDRWMIREYQPAWGTASDFALIALLAGTWIDLGTRDDGLRYLAASAEAAAWTFGITQITKAVVGRLRPVLYTQNAEEAAKELDNKRSFPSGHTSMAFSFATSYWQMSPNESGFKRWLTMGGAMAVGTFRVAAAKHFPSDVVAGAALGTGVAVVVHEVRF